MIFDILEKRIEDAGLGVAGESLFRGAMPAECRIGVMMRVPLEGIPVDMELPGWHRGRIQVICRHTDPVLGETLANAVSRALVIQSRVSAPATALRGAAHIDLFIPETMPISFPRLVGNGLEWSQHFAIAFGLEPAWM